MVGLKNSKTWGPSKFLKWGPLLPSTYICEYKFRIFKNCPENRSSRRLSCSPASQANTNYIYR